MTLPPLRLLFEPRHRFLWLLALGVWTAACVFFAGYFHFQGVWIEERLARAEARISYRKDLAYRHWSSSVGGVYVDARKVAANPYLNVPRRDLLSDTEHPLTLVNPAYMTRLVHEAAAGIYGYKAKLTSLEPRNPHNAADAWETRALQQLQKGGEEYGEMLQTDEGPVYRYLGVFRVEPSCLSCHADQGYKVGDVRGGLSLQFPVDVDRHMTFDGVRRHNQLGLGLLWLVFSAFTTVAFAYHARKVDDERLKSARLQEKEQSLHWISNNSLWGYGRIDLEGMYLEVNERMLRMHGLAAREDMLGHRVLEFVPPDYHEVIARNMPRLFQGESVFVEQVAHLGPGGARGWHATSAMPLVVGGRVVGAEVFLLDITHLIQLRHEVIALMDNMSDAFVLHEWGVNEAGEPNCRFLMINTAYERMFGFSREQVVGHWSRELYQDLDASVYERYRQVVETGVPALFEYEYVGLGRWFMIRAFRPEPGKVACLVSDVTELRKATRNLEEDEALLSAIYEQAPMMLVLMDGQRRVRRANRSLANFTGRKEEEFVGVVGGLSIACLNAIDLDGKCGSGPHCEACLLRRALADALEHGRETTLAEGRFRVVRGTSTEHVVLLFSVKPLEIRGERLVLVCLQDVTQSRRIESQFLRMQRMDSLGSLASGVAHDLNNILVPILMGADLLGGSASSPEAHETLRLIKSSAQRGGALVRQLLLFGRGGDQQRSPVQPQVILQEIGHMIRETFPKSIRFTLRYPEDLASINADATQLHQVLLNLCVNSRDAMPGGGGLLVEALNAQVDEAKAALHPGARVGKHVLLRVRDSGQGMSPELLEKIFDPFFTTKPAGAGTGLGLSTVLGIVRSHDGFVVVESTPGVGTEFRIYLPALEASAPAESSGTGRSLLHGRGELVLVVDDEDLIRRMIRAGLSKANYRVLEASDGASALNLYSGHKGEIAAVICDMMMPHMDGKAAIECVRMINPEVPVVAISGGGRAGGAKKPDLPEGVVFLQKPFELDGLLRALRECLNAASSR